MCALVRFGRAACIQCNSQTFIFIYPSHRFKCLLHKSNKNRGKLKKEKLSRKRKLNAKCMGILLLVDCVCFFAFAWNVEMFIVISSLSSLKKPGRYGVKCLHTYNYINNPLFAFSNCSSSSYSFLFVVWSCVWIESDIFCALSAVWHFFFLLFLILFISIHIFIYLRLR